jgi:hypothetical protein
MYWSTKFSPYRDPEATDLDELSVVPDEQEPVFGYPERSLIQKAIGNLDHMGYVYFNSDALPVEQAMWDRVAGKAT